jgi:hypothetical protein
MSGKINSRELSFYVFIFFWVPFLLSPLNGQEKYEKETRINQREAPAPARRFVDSLKFHKKIKWFREESLTGESIEAKTKRNKQRYSIEFDTLGRLQDVEIEIGWEEIPGETREAIDKLLNQTFSKYRLVKGQKQLKGDPARLIEYLRGVNIPESPAIRYEIVLDGKKGGKKERYEYLFSKSGKLEEKSRIILRNTDNLEY